MCVCVCVCVYTYSVTEVPLVVEYVKAKQGPFQQPTRHVHMYANTHNIVIYTPIYSVTCVQRKVGAVHKSSGGRLL